MSYAWCTSQASSFFLRSLILSAKVKRKCKRVCICKWKWIWISKKWDNQSINKNLNNRKNILRPLSLYHRRFRHLWYSFRILLTLLAYSYFPAFFFDRIELIITFLKEWGSLWGGAPSLPFWERWAALGVSPWWFFLSWGSSSVANPLS